MELPELVAATYASIGQEMSDLGMAVIVRELQAYPAKAVETALTRCAKECRRIALVDILDRLPGGHPGAEEAWAMMAKALNDEGETLVQTGAMQKAFGVALGLQEDMIAARQAFKEVYGREVAEQRACQNMMPRWFVSLGHDASRRSGPVRQAVEASRITPETAAALLCAPIEEMKAIAPDKILRLK